MTADAFIEAIKAMEGLTESMVESLVSMAEELSPEQREEAVATIGKENETIVSAYQEHEELTKETEEEIKKFEKEATKQEEESEQEDNLSEAESALDEA